MKERKLRVKFMCDVRKGGMTVQSDIQKEMYIPLTKDPPRNKKRLRKFIQRLWMQESFGDSGGSPDVPTTLKVSKIISQKKTKKRGKKCKNPATH